MNKLMVKEHLNIEVRGPDRASNTLICKIIGDSLKSAGVRSLDLLNQFGDLIPKGHIKELNAVVQEKNPTLFVSTVCIFADGPIKDEVIVFSNDDENCSFDDDDDSDGDFEFESEPELEC